MTPKLDGSNLKMILHTREIDKFDAVVELFRILEANGFVGAGDMASALELASKAAVKGPVGKDFLNECGAVLSFPEGGKD